MKSITIHDAARRAGVSIKTVSRVINREPNVRDSMRDKVQRAVQELNYKPNPAARGLAGYRSFLVALLYDDSITSAYLVDIQSGVLEVCNAEGYGLVLHPCSHNASSLKNEVEHLITHSQIDGLILTPPICDKPRLITQLDECDAPYVCIAPKKTRQGKAVSFNETQAAFDMTNYLIELGHSRIALIKGHTQHGASRWRFDGYKQAFKQAGIEFDKSLVMQGDFSFTSGEQAAKKLLSRKARPTAIFASNDDMAAGVLHVAHERGVSVPDELSVAGFDDSPLSQHIWPALTTVRQPIHAIGKEAARLLFKSLNKHQKYSLQPDAFSCELKLRESTGPVR